MKKHDGFFKRKKKGDQDQGPSARANTGWSAGEEEEIIDLDDIIDDAERAGDDALVASKLGLDVNLEDIDLDEDLFSKEFDAEQNALLDSVTLDDAEETLKDTDLDAEFRALLEEEGEAALADRRSSAPAEAVDIDVIEELEEGPPMPEPAETKSAVDEPREALVAIENSEAGDEEEPLLSDDLDAAIELDDLEHLAELEQLKELEELAESEGLEELDDLDALEGSGELEEREEVEEKDALMMPGEPTTLGRWPITEDLVEPELAPEPTVVAPAAALPVLDEGLVEQLLDQLEDRLQQAVRLTVEERLPDIVREVLREEIERLREDLAS